jgi:hypothetical protein
VYTGALLAEGDAGALGTAAEPGAQAAHISMRHRSCRNGRLLAETNRSIAKKVYHRMGSQATEGTGFFSNLFCSFSFKKSGKGFHSFLPQI